MNDDATVSDESNVVEERAAEPSALSALIAKLSTPELLMSGAAAWIFVIVFVIGNRLASDYSTSVAVIGALLALIVLASTYAAKTEKGGIGTLYPWVAVTAMWGIVVFAGLDLLNGLFDEFVGNFYEVTLYLAAAAGGAGAYLHGRSE